MKYLIINADDFGLSPEVNEGIIRAWEKGGITNATLMIKREATHEAIRFARENPSFPVGLHLDLDDLFGRDEIGEERFGIERIGGMLKKDHFLDAVEAEIEGQIKAFKDSGLELTHLDGHHHLHALPDLFPLIVEKMLRHDIKTVRFSQSFDLVKYPPISWSDNFFNDMKGLLIKSGIGYANYFIAGWKSYDLKRLKDGVTELMTHPGTAENWRMEELATLTCDEWREAIREQGTTLISFKELARQRRLERT